MEWSIGSRDAGDLEATFEGVGKDPWGRQRAGFAGTS
jgi:hypothetical protein